MEYSLGNMHGFLKDYKHDAHSVEYRNVEMIHLCVVKFPKDQEQAPEDSEDPWHPGHQLSLRELAIERSSDIVRHNSHFTSAQEGLAHPVH